MHESARYLESTLHVLQNADPSSDPRFGFEWNEFEFECAVREWTSVVSAKLWDVAFVHENLLTYIKVKRLVAFADDPSLLCVV